VSDASFTRLAPLAAVIVRLLASTLRLSVRGLDEVAPLWTSERPLIYVVWHGRLLLMPWINARLRRTHRARAVTVLTSRSRDGELAGAYARHFGLDVVRGSSSRGGAAGFRALARLLRQGRDVALVPDGPLGPRHHLQPGVIALATLTGVPIVPVAWSARPSRRLASWDAMLVPLPFARCVVIFGAPMTIGSGVERDVARKDVEQSLMDVTGLADRLVSA